MVLGAFLIVPYICSAQTRNCLTEELHVHKMATDSVYRGRYEHLSSSDITEKSDASVSVDTTIIIPVVVHVIGYNNIYPVTEEQIQTQLDVLNEDYALLNVTSLNIPLDWQHLSKDSKIRFQLAQRDPANNPTDGITWNLGQAAEYNIFDAAIYESDSGGHDAWPRGKYLNLWICKLSGNALGYANYPGSAPNNDGIVISPRAFGRFGNTSEPYNLGRTATHEVGHWLSLIHIWGDDPASTPCSGKDFTGAQQSWDDTPNQAQPTYRCKTFPALDDCATASPGYMYMNYMDYTDDKCMMFFTEGQIKKFRFVLDGIRDSIKLSDGHILPILYNHDLAIDSVLSPVKLAQERCLTPIIRLHNYGSDTVFATTIAYGIHQQLQKNYTWNGALAPDENIVIQLPVIGVSSGNQVMEFRLKESDDRLVNNFRTAGFTINSLTEPNCSASSFQLWPNPLYGAGSFCIKTNEVESQLSSIRLFNEIGQLLFEREANINPGDAFTIDMTNYPSGCYFVQIVGDLFSESLKLIYLNEEKQSFTSINCN